VALGKRFWRRKDSQ